jgi:hypothetical protein
MNGFQVVCKLSKTKFSREMKTHLKTQAVQKSSKVGTSTLSPLGSWNIINRLASNIADLSMNPPADLGSSDAPSLFRRALRQLAGDEDIECIRQGIITFLEESDAPQADLRGLIESKNDDGSLFWSEGTERFKHWPYWAPLHEFGLLDESNSHASIPGLADWIHELDPDFDPWVYKVSHGPEALEEFYSKNKADLGRIVPLWHQLIGIYALVEAVFEGRPMFLMDAVGIGKTFQIIGTICILIYMNEYFMVHGRFPGSFGLLVFGQAPHSESYYLF